MSINNSWQTISIGEFITLQRGHDLTNQERELGIVPVYGAAGQNGFHNKGIAKGLGIVIGTSGGSFGQVYLVKENFWPHNTALYAVDFKGNDVYFTFYLFKLLNFGALNSGSAQPSLNRNFLYPVIIKIPPPQEQKKIAFILSSIDSKIETNNKINATLEAMAKTLYDYWFVQFDFPNEEGKPYKASGGKMVYNEELKREIPEGWEVKSLLEVASFINGLACQKFRPVSEHSLPVIKIKEMNEGITNNTESVRSDIPEKYVVENGDVLFSWSATLDVKIWTGGKGGLNQHIFKVTSDKYPKSYFYFELFNYLEHFKMIAELRKTTMGHITQDHLKESRIVLPQSKLIKALDEKLNPLLSKIVSNRIQNQELASLRDWLLPMLMNGQVSVGKAYEHKDELGMVAEESTQYKKKTKR